MSMESAALTDTGRVRQHNEDAYLHRPDRRLFVVADGMGGHAAGEVASAMAVRMLEKAVLDTTDARSVASGLVHAILEANQRIVEQGTTVPAWEGMGTTVIALAFPDDGVTGVIGHVGDSRAYLLRAKRLERLTRDHTWVQDQVDAGRLDAAFAQRHPYANVLSRVLGLPELESVDTAIIETRAQDLFMLCSDGLTTLVPDSRIAEILGQAAPLDALAASLIDEANARGGVDNCTVILVRT